MKRCQPLAFTPLAGLVSERERKEASQAFLQINSRYSAFSKVQRQALELFTNRKKNGRMTHCHGAFVAKCFEISFLHIFRVHQDYLGWEGQREKRSADLFTSVL